MAVDAGALFGTVVGSTDVEGCRKYNFRLLELVHQIREKARRLLRDLVAALFILLL